MKPDELIKLIATFKQLISELFFKGQEPQWLALAINYSLLFLLLLLGFWAALVVIGQCIKIWAEQIRPLYYDQALKKRLRNRQRFANHIEQEIRQLNSREEWKDYRFTELEAEVEAEGKRLRLLPLPFFRSSRRGLRREQSLSKALELSGERLIILAGDPGSGKSIALRHVAEKLALRSSKDKNIKSIIPLYVNLKKLERPAQVAINRELIESFVKQELNRINDRDIEQFLEEEFQVGVKEGTWLFLFDSFDELPEVLSSVEADTTIGDYAQAIDDFLNGFNQCRGIIASRQFRGPKHLGWPLFRILPLDSRRWELIRKAELDPPIEKELSGRLRVATQEIEEMTKNPMFLGILCENMRAGNDFPNNTHAVFESYLEARLARDATRLQKRFQLQPTDVRMAAERIAFCMSIDTELGLSPSRDKIQEAMERHHLVSSGDVGRYMNALEYLKLARSEQQAVPGSPEHFTFSHRRFQEYFATCIVLSDLTRISPRLLLTDGRWRETAVVILQTQAAEEFAPILAEASELVQEMTRKIPDLIADPYAYINPKTSGDVPSVLKPFAWPAGLQPLLSLLQDGLMGRMREFPADIQDNASRILLTASSRGSLADQKWSLEVAGITPQPVLLWLLRRAFASKSQWLKEVAYRQTARLGEIPEDIAAAIRKSLKYLFSEKRLNKEYYATLAHLSRLDQPSRFISSLRLLKLIPIVDSLLKGGVLLGLIALGSIFHWKEALVFVAILILYILVEKAATSARGHEWYDPFAVYLYRILWLTRWILFPLLWTPFAIFASEQGQFTNPIWWSFLALLPVLYIVFDFNRALKHIALHIEKDVITLVFLALLPLALIAARKIAESMFYKNFSLFITAFAVPPSLALIYFVYQSTRIARILLADKTKFRHWLKTPIMQVTAEELLHLLCLYQSTEYSMKLVATIRERNSLIASDASENLINELALKLDSEIRSKPLTSDLADSKFFRSWMENYTRKDKSRLKDLGTEFLDEIYITLEQIRSKRKGTDADLRNAHYRPAVSSSSDCRR
jgi:hypothetical protein